MADEKLPPSVEWVGNRVTSLLRTKPELFAKLYLTEADADVQPIRRFMSDDSCTKIFFLASAKELLVMEVPPPSNKKKARATPHSQPFASATGVPSYLLSQTQIAYCFKTAEWKFAEKQTTDDWFEKVQIGDLNAGLLESMHSTLRHVYLPIISNPRPGQQLSEVAFKALQDRYHMTIAAVVVAIGQTRGKTLLPLPPVENDNAPAGEKDAKDRVHILESAVVQWTDRINQVEKITPWPCYHPFSQRASRRHSPEYPSRASRTEKAPGLSLVWNSGRRRWSTSARFFLSCRARRSPKFSRCWT